VSLHLFKRTTKEEAMTYTIEQYTVPMSYDDPIQPEPTWMSSPHFWDKEWKTEAGARRALEKHLRICNGDPAKYRLRQTV
ncbi:hypothetical protein, partial [Bifidobacterium xylocopae]